jgi:hypothetical protein
MYMRGFGRIMILADAEGESNWCETKLSAAREFAKLRNYLLVRHKH